MHQSSQKTQIGDLELAPIAPKYGTYLALPAGPEPAVWRLAPKTGLPLGAAGGPATALCERCARDSGIGIRGRPACVPCMM